jgi:twitching motility protein PilT
MARIDTFFQTILEKGASDLHLAQGQPARMRLHGNIVAIDDKPFDEEPLCLLLQEICSDDRWVYFRENGDIDFAYSMSDGTRFRCNYYRHAHGYGAVFRIIPTDIQSIAGLGLPSVLASFADLSSGLVLVTGPTGSGKSTTLAAVIDHINANYARHVLTIEEPIEFVHSKKRSIIVQREVGIDALSFGDALLGKLESVMMGGKSAGMQIMDDVLEGYHAGGGISGHEAYMKAINKERFEKFRDETD